MLLVLSMMKKKIQLLLYLTKKLMHCKSTTQRLLLILRWIKLLLKSLVRPENDGNVLANVLEEEVSFDVDLHEAIEDQDSEVRGTCGWRGRLQINLTLGSITRVVGENHVEPEKREHEIIGARGGQVCSGTV